MTKRTKTLLKEAIKLSDRERAELVDKLLPTLDSAPANHEVDAAWALEIERRADELISGAVQPLPWDEVRKKAMRWHGAP